MAINTIVSEAGKFSYDRFHFAEARESNGFVFCSGIIGADRGKIPEDIQEEFRNAWSGVSAAHPFENPTGLSFYLEMGYILFVPAAITFMVGWLTKNRKIFVPQPEFFMI